MKRALLVLLVASGAFAQSTFSVGVNTPDPGTCNSIMVGSLYVRSEDPTIAPIGVFRCSQVSSVATAWQPIDHLVLSTLPAKCSIGDIGYQTSGTTGLYACTATNTWTKPSNVLVGDASGASTSTVVTFNGVSVLPPATAATASRIYEWTGAATANTCPLSGAGGSGGGAIALCTTLDGANWQPVILGDTSNNVAIDGSSTIVYRCATSGALPAGALTIATGSCGTTADTGLRIK